MSQQGQQYSQDGGGSHRPNISETSGNTLVQANPAPPRCDPDQLVYLALAFQPDPEGKG